MFSKFFILSLRGDILIYRDFRPYEKGASRAVTDMFFLRVKTPAKGEIDDPVFNIDGIQFIHIKRNGMYFVFTTRKNTSPALAMELLERFAGIIKDYCGVLTEEAIRKNFTLVYELIDEGVDFGYPQGTESEELKAFMQNKPILTDTETRSALLSTIVSSKTTSSKTANQSVAIEKKKNKKDEIFVDLLERLTVSFSGNGQILHSEIEGAIIIKSFIKGKPKIKLGLNEDIVIGRNKEGIPALNRTVLDQACFHECVMFNEWDIDRTIVFYPPDGEFALLRYRTTDDFVPPFRIDPYVEIPGMNQLDVFIKVSAEFPPTNFGNRITVRCPVPASTGSASCEMENSSGSYEFDTKNKEIIWSIGKFHGGGTTSIRIKLNLDDAVGNYLREVGPVSMDFEIPMYVCSSVQIRFLRATDMEKEIKPYRWVRSITKTDHYNTKVDVSSVPRSRYMNY